MITWKIRRSTRLTARDPQKNLLQFLFISPLKGLKLNLFIESSEYLGFLSHSAGARILIHGQGEMPYPDDEGINLAWDFYFHWTAKEKCLDDLLKKFKNEGLDCDTRCPVPCSEVTFNTAMSLAEWPSESYQGIFRRLVAKRLNKSKGQDHYVPINKNFLQARVFYEKLNYQEVKEHLSYEGINLVADIGGQLGLWIGLSVLTCFEVLELVLLLIQRIWKKVTIKKRIPSKEDVKTWETTL
ncbi:ligand-gated sodium channel [Desmophyllum pertusum]|uniref:Ligand-gated sodium channel n=1 Tax=Desmophyllum pertusum TaxID=174260 RepID=A0A9W9YNM4_9CNID|nr:ligand-gated sodium channel [Desmophyllum pertusum]